MISFVNISILGDIKTFGQFINNISGSSITSNDTREPRGVSRPFNWGGASPGLTPVNVVTVSSVVVSVWLFLKFSMIFFVRSTIFSQVIIVLSVIGDVRNDPDKVQEFLPEFQKMIKDKTFQDMCFMVRDFIVNALEDDDDKEE
jgi:hypothetical protein